eukprot:scaffold139745_cov127-Phaeocystis_antarctica.AAC.2
MGKATARPCAHAVGRGDVGRKPAQHGDRRSRKRLRAVGLSIAPAYEAGEVVTIIFGGRRRKRAREQRHDLVGLGRLAEQLAPAAAHRLRPRQPLGAARRARRALRGLGYASRPRGARCLDPPWWPGTRKQVSIAPESAC